MDNNRDDDRKQCDDNMTENDNVVTTTHTKICNIRGCNYVGMYLHSKFFVEVYASLPENYCVFCRLFS